MMKIEKYPVKSGKTEAYLALQNTIPPTDEYMHYRLNGNAADVCEDIFFVAHSDGVALSRLWMCYPKHKNAVSNWGAFFTLEGYRGQGIGAKVLKFCFDEIAEMKNPPTALLCTAGSVRLTEMYRKYGFVPAIHGTDCGPLYRPLGDSPAGFQKFCEKYYTPAEKLRVVKADFGWRNEVDCLLKFAMLDMGKSYDIDGETDLNLILLHTPKRDVRILLTEDDKCVGWMLDGKAKIHPAYANLPIEV